MEPASSSCSSCGPWWRLPLLLGLVLLALMLMRDGGVRDVNPEQPDDKTQSAPAAQSSQQVSLAIDFGDGRRRKFEPIAWREGMTVRDLTTEARKFDQRPDVQGSGAAAFLQSLDGVANEGADGRNWMYTVNGTLGDRSFAIYELTPGDQVLWTFGGQQ